MSERIMRMYTSCVRRTQACMCVCVDLLVGLRHTERAHVAGAPSDYWLTGSFAIVIKVAPLEVC